MQSKYLDETARCVVRGTLQPDPHHIYTRKARPDLEFEPWNIISLHHDLHVLWHQKGTVYMVEKYPEIKQWMLKNGWEFLEFNSKWINQNSIK